MFVFLTIGFLIVLQNVFLIEGVYFDSIVSSLFQFHNIFTSVCM